MRGATTVWMICASLIALSGCGWREPYVLTKLYFGLNSPAGVISEQQFEAFVDSVVTPRFPDGLTVYAASGQWRTDSATVEKEQSMIIEIIHASGRNAEYRLDTVISSYKRTFNQQSVLLVRERPITVRF